MYTGLLALTRRLQRDYARNELAFFLSFFPRNERARCSRRDLILVPIKDQRL